MCCRLVSDERSGASVALYPMFDAHANARFMVDHSMSPQLSIETSFSALPESSCSHICVKFPVMLTV